MPDKFKIATAVLAGVLVYDYRVARHNRKLRNQLVQDNQNLIEVAQRAHKQVDYLSNKLYEADVQIDEFDRIIFANL